MVAGACMFSGPCEPETRVLPSAFTGKGDRMQGCLWATAASRTGTDATGGDANQVVWGWCLRHQDSTGPMSGLLRSLGYASA